MSFTYDHERFVAKNRSLASAEEAGRKDTISEKKGVPKKDGSCFTCKMKQACSEFKSKRSGRSSGVVSFGGDERFLCDRYTPAQTQARAMSEKQIKSLLKNTKKGY